MKAKWFSQCKNVQVEPLLLCFQILQGATHAQSNNKKKDSSNFRAAWLYVSYEFPFGFNSDTLLKYLSYIFSLIYHKHFDKPQKFYQIFFVTEK